MLKINHIKLLKIIKIFFYISAICTLAIFFSLNVMSFIKPCFSGYENWNLSIGSYEGIMISKNLITNFSLKNSFIIFYSFGVLFFVATWVLYLIIQTSQMFSFNSNKLFLAMSIFIFLITLYLILVSCIIFIKPIDKLNLISTNNEWKHLSTLFDYKINDKIKFELSNNGIASMVFFCIETVWLFFTIVYFSYKIIKKKYI